MTLLELVNNKHHFTPDQFRRLFDAHETIKSLPLTANKEVLAKAVIALRKKEGGTNTERANFVKETEHYLQMEVGLIKSNYIEQRWASTQIGHYNDSVRSMTKSGPKKQYRKRATSRFAKLKRIAEQEGTNEAEIRASDVESSASEDDNALVGEDCTLQQLFFNKPKHRSERNSYFRKVDRDPEFQELLQHRGETLPKAVAAYVFAQGLEGSKLKIFRDELNLHLLPHVKYAGIKLIKEEWKRQQDAKFKKRHAEAHG